MTFPPKLGREIKKYHSSRRIVFFDGRNLGPQNIKYGTCQFGSFLRRATSPLSLPALPYPAPIFSARASSATVADALISLSNVTSRPRHAFDTWYFLRGVVWSHAGCWVALLFSLVDPYLWIFSSRHRHIHATDSAQKAIQGSIREDPRVSAARCCWVAWAALLFSLVDPHLWIFSSRFRICLCIFF